MIYRNRETETSSHLLIDKYIYIYIYIYIYTLNIGLTCQKKYCTHAVPFINDPLPFKTSKDNYYIQKQSRLTVNIGVHDFTRQGIAVVYMSSVYLMVEWLASCGLHG